MIFNLFISIFENKEREVLGVDLKLYNDCGCVVRYLNSTYSDNPNYRSLETTIYKWLSESKLGNNNTNTLLKCNNKSFLKFFTGVVSKSEKYNNLLNKENFEHSTLAPLTVFDEYSTKIYFDASYDHTTLECVIATVIMCHDVVVAKAVSYGKSRSIFGAEHYGLDFAIRYYKKISKKHEEIDDTGSVVFIGDSQQVISALFSKNVHRKNGRIRNTFLELQKLNAEIAWVNSKDNLADKFTKM